MAATVSLSAAARSSLLSLQGTADLIDRTNNRLSSGLRVASPIDDSKIFFEARALSDRAQDLDERKDNIDQGISSLSTALETAESVDALVRQAKGIALSAKTATGTELTSLVTQYNTVLAQIDLLVADGTFQGLNLVNNSTQTLTVQFSELTTSILTVTAQRLDTNSLGLDITSASSFSLTSIIDAAIVELDAAITELRGASKTLGSNVALLQTRLDFTESYVNELEKGADKLTLADVTEEGANLVALQTRQQLGINALAFAGQSEQNILALFR